MSNRNFLIALVSAAVLSASAGAVAWTSFNGIRPARLSVDLSAPWSERVTFWGDVIAREGGATAYESFALSAENMTFEQRHEMAHAFGSALFKADGTKGISVCDSRFSFGCYHQFLADAITMLGVERINELNAACFEANTKSPLSCQHGIGHGALAAIGYDEESMHQALALCRDLPGTNPIGGCYGGVFMEYNMQTTLASAGQVRAYHGEPFDSCENLDKPFIPACIYWQPQWWMITIFPGVPDEEAFRTMGGYCERYRGNAELARSCYEGVGNITAYESGFEPGRAKELCTAFSELPVAQLLCRSTVATHFRDMADVATAESMCDGLEGAPLSFCLVYAKSSPELETMRLPYEL